MTRYNEELQAWKDFELEYLIEEEPPLDPSIAGINWEDPDLWDPESGTDIGRNSDYIGVCKEDYDDFISSAYLDYDDYDD
jgi:hypothetical protein